MKSPSALPRRLSQCAFTAVTLFPEEQYEAPLTITHAHTYTHMHTRTHANRHTRTHLYFNLCEDVYRHVLPIP